MCAVCWPHGQAQWQSWIHVVLTCCVYSAGIQPTVFHGHRCWSVLWFESETWDVFRWTNITNILFALLLNLASHSTIKGWIFNCFLGLPMLPNCPGTRLSLKKDWGWVAQCQCHWSCWLTVCHRFHFMPYIWVIWVYTCDWMFTVCSQYIKNVFTSTIVPKSKWILMETVTNYRGPCLYWLCTTFCNCKCERCLWCILWVDVATCTFYFQHWCFYVAQ